MTTYIKQFSDAFPKLEKTLYPKDPEFVNNFRSYIRERTGLNIIQIPLCQEGLNLLANSDWKYFIENNNTLELFINPDNYTTTSIFARSIVSDQGNIPLLETESKTLEFTFDYIQYEMIEALELTIYKSIQEKTPITIRDFTKPDNNNIFTERKGYFEYPINDLGGLINKSVINNKKFYSKALKLKFFDNTGDKTFTIKLNNYEFKIDPDKLQVSNEAQNTKLLNGYNGNIIVPSATRKMINFESTNINGYTLRPNVVKSFLEEMDLNLINGIYINFECKAGNNPVDYYYINRILKVFVVNIEFGDFYTSYFYRYQNNLNLVDENGNAIANNEIRGNVNYIKISLLSSEYFYY